MQTNPLKTKDTSDRVRALVEAGLKRKGISGRQASLQLVGHDGLIRDIRAGRLPGIDKLETLFDLLDLEFYFGPPRDHGPQPPEADPAALAQIPLHEALLAAGNGVENGTEHVSEYLAFRKDWLRKIGLLPSNAALARASGDSMQPVIWDGDMLLIDRSKIEPPPAAQPDRLGRHAPVFALLDDGMAKVKRLQMLDKATAVLISDNPDYPPLFAKVERLSIIGKVVWWGHTSKE